MAENSDTRRLAFAEFVPLAALLTSLVALTIDAMLPALPDIGADLHAKDPNAPQLVVSSLFLGLAFGQLIYGPLSDSIGRKPAIYLGMLLFMGGCILSVFAASFEEMLVGRVLQGLGVAGPRVVIIALIRDLYEGRAMARIMSFVMSVFILVPALAPALGQAILLVGDWRLIFVAFLVLAVLVTLWFAIRQEETLAPEQRRAFNIGPILAAVVETCSYRVSLGYMLAASLIFGAFIGYLNSAQQILQEQYALGTQFPLYFAALALAIGVASLVNASLVMHFGMRLLSRWALHGLTALSLVYLAAIWPFAGHPPLWSLMAYCLIAFFCLGLLFANYNALAMEPLGHIAGTGAAVVGSFTTFISMMLGGLIGYAYDGTILPLVAGFAVCGIAAALVGWWTEAAPASSGPL